jgi:hypothetical protein
MQLKVIEGGRGLGTAPPDAAEAKRLRKALLQLRVEEFGLTVEDCLAEMSMTGDSEEDAHQARFLLMMPALHGLGLRYVTADAEHELERRGY